MARTPNKANPLTLAQVATMSRDDLYEATRRAAIAVERRERNLKKAGMQPWSWAHNYLINPETGRVNKIRYKGLSKQDLMLQYNRAQFYMSYGSGLVTGARKAQKKEMKMLEQLKGGDVTATERKIYNRVRRKLATSKGVAGAMDWYEVIKVVYQSMRDARSDDKKLTFKAVMEQVDKNLEETFYSKPENQPLKSPIEMVTTAGGWPDDPNKWFKNG